MLLCVKLLVIVSLSAPDSTDGKPSRVEDRTSVVDIWMVVVSSVDKVGLQSEDERSSVDDRILFSEFVVWSWVVMPSSVLVEVVPVSVADTIVGSP